MTDSSSTDPKGNEYDRMYGRVYEFNLVGAPATNYSRMLFSRDPKERAHAIAAFWLLTSNSGEISDSLFKEFGVDPGQPRQALAPASVVQASVPAAVPAAPQSVPVVRQAQAPQPRPATPQIQYRIFRWNNAHDGIEDTGRTATQDTSKAYADSNNLRRYRSKGQNVTYIMVPKDYPVDLDSGPGWERIVTA